MKIPRHGCAVLLCAALSVSAHAQTPSEADTSDPSSITPDLSGNDSHWIEDPDTGCFAANPAPEDGESVSWSGACEDGLITGRGTLTWYRYGQIVAHDVGTFALGALTGHGLIEHTDGTRYSGEFPGRGTLTLPDGAVFNARTRWTGYGWAIEGVVE